MPLHAFSILSRFVKCTIHYFSILSPDAVTCDFRLPPRPRVSVLLRLHSATPSPVWRDLAHVVLVVLLRHANFVVSLPNQMLSSGQVGVTFRRDIFHRVLSERNTAHEQRSAENQTERQCFHDTKLYAPLKRKYPLWMACRTFRNKARFWIAPGSRQINPEIFRHRVRHSDTLWKLSVAALKALREQSQG